MQTLEWQPLDRPQKTNERKEVVEEVAAEMGK